MHETLHAAEVRERAWRLALAVITGAAILTALLVAPGTAAAQSDPVITDAVQVTDNPSPVRAHSTPQMMRDPTTGDLVVIESDPRSDDRTCEAYRSTDEGRSWEQAGSLMLEPYTDCSIHGEYGPYATGAFSDDGTLYVAFVASDPRYANPGTLPRDNPPPPPPNARYGARDCPPAHNPAVLVAAADWASVVTTASTSRASPLPELAPEGSSCPGKVQPVAHPPRRTPRQVFLARSSDGGRSFETTVVFKGPEQPVRAPERQPSEGINKGPMVAVDPEDSSNVYVGWRQGDLREDQGKLRSLVAASTNGGADFGDPVDLSGEQGGDFPALAVDSEGTLHAVYWARTFGVDQDETPVSPIYYQRSTDQGETFTESTQIDPGNQDTDRPPLIAADPNSDNVYVVWSAPPEAQNGSEDFEGDSDVLMLVSPDSGQEWSDKRTINDDDMDVDQYLPGIAVAPNGRVDVAWYDDRSPTRIQSKFQDVYYAASLDAGETFSPNVRINDRVIDRNIGVWGNNILSRHNVGIASSEDSVYFAWQDTRNGDATTQAEDVYAAQLDWSGTTATTTATGLGADRLLWAAIGGGVALMAAGGVLGAATRLRRSA